MLGGTQRKWGVLCKNVLERDDGGIGGSKKKF